MPLSATSHARLQQFQQDNPARLEKLLEGVKAGDITAADAAAEIPGLTAADVMDVAVNGVEDLANNAGAQALGRAGADAPSTFGGIGPGGTLASKGILFEQTFETVASAQAALKQTTKRPARNFKERMGEMMPEFRGGTTKSVLKAIAIGGATAAGAFFVNPLLTPGAFLVATYMGLKAQALPGEKKSKKDPITAEEGAALKAAFDGATDAEKGAIAAATVGFSRDGLEIAPEAEKALDEIAAFASQPAGQTAQRLLDVSNAVQALFTDKEPDIAGLKSALAAMPAEELEEVRPFLWDALHDKKGNASIDLDSDPELAGLVFSDKSAEDLAAYMCAAFCAAGSHGGEQISKKEVNLLLARLERFDASVSHPALVAVGEQLPSMNIDPKAALVMAAVLEGIAGGDE
jgi:hypothetical protein